MAKKQKATHSTKKKRASVQPPRIKFRSTNSNVSPYPADDLKALFTLTGKATIQGVHFDLCPEQIGHQGWRPWALKYGQDPFLESSLRFPWNPGPQNVRAGDTVGVICQSHNEGHELDHQSDQDVMLVNYKVSRNGKTIREDSQEMEFYKEDTFLLWLDFEAAVLRIRNLIGADNSLNLLPMVGDTRSDPSKYGPHNHHNAEFAEERALHSTLNNEASANHALGSAFATNAHWAAIVIAVRSNTTQSNGKHNFTQQPLFKKIGDAIDSAAAFGYWLAKTEFAPHVKDTLVGRRITGDRKRGGNTRKEQLANKADRWRVPALTLAINKRTANSKLGQKALADIILEAPFMAQLVSDGLREGKNDFHELERDTVVFQIKKWELSGELQISSRNPKSKTSKK